jgi:RNA polymerase sigma-70 factor (ECF subfamily)
LNYSSLDDGALIRQIANARPDALSVLYDRYGRLVYSLALNVLGDAESAEEVTQDVFVRVWEKAGTYRVEQAKVSTWLTSITRNRSIDLLRRRGVRPEGHSIGWEDLTADGSWRLDGRAPDPEEQAVQSIRGQRVRAAISNLPPEQQQALALAFFGGFSHTEIAARLGEPLGTVKTRIRMAMQRLRNLLEEEQRAG